MSELKLLDSAGNPTSNHPHPHDDHNHHMDDAGPVPDSPHPPAAPASAADAAKLTPSDSFYRNKNRSSAVPNVNGTSSSSSSSNKTDEKAADSKGKDKDGKDKDKDKKKPMVPIYRLWRFATPFECLLLVIGFFASIAHGITQPIMTVAFGNLIDAFAPGADILAVVSQACIYFLIIAAVAFVGGTLQVATFSYVAQQQVSRIRQRYLRAIIRQEMAWFDSIQSGELTTRIAGDVIVIQEGIADKVGSGIQFLTMFVAGFVIGFVRQWKMALVILSVVPLLAIAGGIIGKFLADFTTRGQGAYAKAGGVAEEVLSSMRTVTAFSGQERETIRYGIELLEALRVATKGGHLRGLSIGVVMFIMFCSYGLGFWYGAKLILSGDITAGGIVNVFFAVIMGAMGLGQASPSFTALASARGAAFTIFETIDRDPEIDTLSEEGEKPETVKGDIVFDNLFFNYPKRPDVPILQGLTVSVKAGQTLALVGPSGCGKSTTVALLQRFYDPKSGVVTLDGTDIRKLNVRWLRSQIGVVSQEPILFGRTITQNIMLGKEKSTQAEVEAAAKMANAHDFISKLPQGYDTLVGERGAALSGGQKQRIAIARALLRDPKILLLDEATSALDTKSERVVQEALDRASKGRTTIVIAHRLSTIQNADKIVVIEKGQVIEQGTHHELMEKDGLYASLVRTQQVRGAIKGTDGKSTGSSSNNTYGSDDVKASNGSIDHSSDGDDDDVVLNHEALQANANAAAAKPANVRTNTSQSTHSKTEKKIGPDGKEEEVIDPEDAKIPTKGVIWRAYRLNAPEWFFLFMGVLGALANGGSFPVYSILFSHVLQDLLTLQGDELMSRASFWSIMFVVLACGIGLANYLQNAMLTIAGERLTERLRRMLFRAVVRQNIGWFDEPRHSTGALATRLANDSARVQGAVGGNLGILTQTVSTLVTGLVIAFIACWQLALVVLACVPLAAAGGAVQMRLMMGFNQSARKAYEESGKVASETVENIRTVVSLGREQTFQTAYKDSLAIPNRAGRRQAFLNGLAFGFSQAMTFLIWTVSFYYGAKLVSWQIIQFGDMMQAITAIIFGGMMIGQATQLSPDFNKAVIAAANIFHLVDQTPAIDSFNSEGKKLDKVEGKVTVDKVTFRYPTRPDVQVLKGLSFSIDPGKTLALVGASGCGKSTVIGLLERFYDPESGTISIDGIPTKEINITSLRGSMGLVGQEPILFATSIYDNILYGKPNATREEVEQAARNANIHDFIESLPDKYNTYVGEKGTQLSGGQKQRIAIARALVRNPKILLLDEATSALDSESEKVVQEALDHARRGRTTIVIAHRLSTIQDADMIAVVDNGVIVEMGTHSGLLATNGAYAQLVQRQAVPL